MLRAADDVVRGLAVALEQQVGFADGVGLAVDLLTVEVRGDLLAVGLGDLLERFLRDGQHAAGAAGAVVEQVGAGLDLVGHGQEHEIGHQPDGVAGRPVLAGFLVVLLVEAADEFLEHRAHRVVVEGGQVADRVRAEVDVLVEELLDELPQSVGLREAGNLVAELEVDQDVLHVGREAIEVSLEVVLELLLGGAGLQVAEQERRGVVERLARCGAQGVVLVGDLLAIEGGFHFQHGLLGRLQHGVETAQHRHGQDHVAVLAADIDVAQHVVRDVPDEVGNGVQLGLVHIRSRLRMRSAMIDGRLLVLGSVHAVGGLASR